ncbi:MAG: T9SS type A sorting domain-containing protein [Flavobacteriales bacterium]|nr:T9SS type A sorting domain-containing protein [Flavobacteriales bacterium]
MNTRYTLAIAVIGSTSLNAQVFDWAGSMGYAGDQVGNAIAVDQSGNVYHTGTFLNGIDLDPGIGVDEITVAGDQAGYVIKQANDGTYLWGEHFVGNVMPSQLCVAPNGDVVVVGSYVNAADLDPGPGTYIMGGEDWPWLFICRLNPQGELLWAKRSGDNNGMWPPSVVIDAFDRVHLTGSFVGEIDADPGEGVAEVHLLNASQRSTFIITLDGDGEFIRAVNFAGNGWSHPNAITADAEGRVYVTGSFVYDLSIQVNGADLVLISTEPSTPDVFMVKLEADGTPVGALSFGGPYNDAGNAIAVNAQQDVFIAGMVEYNADLDPGAPSFISTSNRAPFYAKFDMDGNFVQAALGEYPGGSDNAAHGIGLDGAGNIYLSGGFNGIDVDFDPGPGTTAYTTNGNSHDGFLVKYSPTGSYLWSVQLGSIDNSREWINGLAIDQAGSAYMTGVFSNTMDLDPGPGSYILTPADVPYSDAFVLKLDPTTLEVRAGSKRDGSVAYPVPSGSVVHLVMDQPVNNATLRVYDAAGSVIHSRSGISGDRTVVDLSPFTPGAYRVEVIDAATGLRVQKAVVKQ